MLLLSFATGFFGNNHRAFGRMLSATSGKRKRVSCTQRHQLNCFGEFIKYSDKKLVVIVQGYTRRQRIQPHTSKARR